MFELLPEGVPFGQALDELRSDGFALAGVPPHGSSIPCGFMNDRSGGLDA